MVFGTVLISKHNISVADMQCAICVHISIIDVNPHLTIAAQPHDCVDDVWVAGHTNLEHGRIIITVMFSNLKVR